MSMVGITRAHSLVPGSFWDKSLGDLIVDAASPLLDDGAIDGLFCAGGDPFGGRTDFAAFAADRLGLRPEIALSFDGADIAGALAFFGAWANVRGGSCRRALILGAAKVSDVSERDRLALMDCTLDPEADIARGIDFAAQAGLLAGEYCRLREQKPDVFATTSAANLAAWAAHKGRPQPTVAELRRDLPVSPPLVRSDFAQLLDGACALLLEAADRPVRAMVRAMGQATDILSVWERTDPLAFSAAETASTRALASVRPNRLEIDAGVSVAQRLAEDAVARSVAAHSAKGEAFAPHVNARGGAQGRGRVFGVSSLYQIADVAEIIAKNEKVLMLAVSGLGAHVASALIEGAS